jgi:hypothetical protein
MLSPLIAGEPTTADVLELTTPRYTAVIQDDEGQPLPAASLTSLTLTLYVIRTDGTIGIINSRNAQNVLNASNVTVSAAGLLVWSIQTADTALQETLAFERHIALWTWTWLAGAKTGRHELVLTVKNLQQVS